VDNFLRRDWVLRAIAVVMAIAVWSQVETTTNPIEKRTYTGVPITVTGEAPGRVARVQPSVGAVEVQGPASVFNGLSSSDIGLSVDVRGYEAGTRLLPVTVHLPPGTAVLTQSPARARVTIYPVEAFRRQVVVTASGHPAAGLYVSGLAYPPSVEVLGPSDLLATVVAVRGTVSLDGASGSFTRVVSLAPVDAQGRMVAGVRLDPAAVAVSVTLARYPAKTVPVTVQLTGAVPPGYAVTASAVSPTAVAVYGPANVLSGLTGLQVAVSVDGRRQTFTTSVPVPVPPGATADPHAVTITVDIAPR
jgi:YbbR domain-containing protein